jgi:hypothetical protein
MWQCYKTQDTPAVLNVHNIALCASSTLLGFGSQLNTTASLGAHVTLLHVATAADQIVHRQLQNDA